MNKNLLKDGHLKFESDQFEPKCTSIEQLPRTVSEICQKLDRIESLLLNQNYQSNDSEKLLTIEEAAVFLHLTKKTLYKLVHNKAIPYSKPNRRLYFSEKQLFEWAQASRKRTYAEVQADIDNSFLKRKGSK